MIMRGKRALKAKMLQKEKNKRMMLLKLVKALIRVRRMTLVTAKVEATKIAAWVARMNKEAQRK